MIYLDTSVALAAILTEPRKPSDALWRDHLISSRLLHYELMVRINTRGLAQATADAVRVLLDGIALVDLDEKVLARGLLPFPRAVRTLDALHLATMVYLRSQGFELRLATYDKRLADTAEALGFPLADV